MERAKLRLHRLRRHFGEPAATGGLGDIAGQKDEFTGTQCVGEEIDIVQQRFRPVSGHVVKADFLEPEGRLARRGAARQLAAKGLREVGPECAGVI